MNFSKETQDYLDVKLEQLEGWCSHRKAESIIYDVILKKPKRCVEIGVFAGRSLFAIGFALRDISAGGTVIGVDPWKADASAQGMSPVSEEDQANLKWWTDLDYVPIKNKCVNLITEYGLNGQIQIACSTSKELHYGYQYGCEAKPVVDWIHIDGNHTEEVSVQDVENWMPLVIPGSSVWFDDMDWDSTKKAQQALLKFCTPTKMVGTCGVFQRK